MPVPTRVHFITLGCPKNEVDSDRMKALVESSAYEVVDDLDSPHVVVVNTCAFIEPAVEEAIQTVLELATWRDAAPGRRLVVAGCLPSRYGGELETALTEADAFLPLDEEPTLLRLISRLTGTDPLARSGPPRTAPGPSAYLQVSDGCFRRCAYCTIPAIRGPYRSRPLPQLAEEAAWLASHGARELVLVGQDTGAYGRDLSDDDTLSDVLRTLAGIDGVAWLRVMYLQPDGLTDELLRTMAELPQVCHYVDVPLQHVVPRVLRAMRRSGSAEEFLRMLERLRAAMPDVAVRTTVMTGFPGETDEDVDALVEFVRAADFDYVGVFPFSPEEGTPAASLPGLPPKSVRLARAQAVRDAADAIGFARASALVGRPVEVLVEGVDEDGVTVGRWRGQAPEVDGLVMLSGTAAPGTIVNAVATDAFGYDLEAVIEP